MFLCAIVSHFICIMNLMQIDKFVSSGLQQRILDYYRKVPQERLFVHTDKPCYTPGDTVWFRAHVVDAVTHMPVARSRYVYVELVDLVADTLTLRVKVKCDSDGVFAGHLALPKALRPGGYALAAYTRWMVNFGAERFFYRQVMVAGGDGIIPIDTPAPREVSEGRGISVSHPTPGDSLLELGVHGGQLRIRSLAPDVSCVLCGSGNLYVREDMGGGVLRIDEQSLRKGYVLVALVDKRTEEVIARRLVFVHGGGGAVASITGRVPDGRREPVRLAINVTDTDGSPLEGTLSLSVADNGAVLPDTLQPDIGEYLWSESEKDAAELPLADMLAGRLPSIRWGFETSQGISGEVRGTLRKKVKSPRLLLVNTLTGWRGEFALGDSSRFAICGLDFPDGTTFTMEGVRRSGKNAFVQIVVDGEEHPRLRMPRFPSLAPPPRTFLIQEEKMQGLSRTDDGSVELPEVVKTGRRQEVKYRNLMRVTPPRGMAKGDPRIERFPTIFHLLRFCQASWEGKVKLYIDGFYCDPEIMENGEWLHDIMPDQVESVEFFPRGDSRTLIYGNDAVIYGLLLIYTRDPLEWAREKGHDPLSMAVVKTQGYQIPREFHSPRYDQANKNANPSPDLRTTLYWNPKLRVEGGRVEVTFFSSDVSSKFLVTLQGVTDDGRVVSKQEIIKCDNVTKK